MHPDATLAHPGSWVVPAQAALDDLAELTTIDQIAEHFPDIRRLAQVLLGHPVTGGHATKPVIRAIGQLFRHRLGPSVAAEALSWATAVSHVVDTTGIEQLLGAATDAWRSFRPLRLEERGPLTWHLEHIKHPAKRRNELLRLWNHELFLDREIAAHLLPPDQPLEFVFRWGWMDERNLGDGDWNWFTTSAPDGEPGSVCIAGLARSDDLFDRPDNTVIRCIQERLDLVLRNESCPIGLRDMIRHPYNRATLELAIRAGASHYEPARVRRMLGELDDDAFGDLWDRHPNALLRAWIESGLAAERHGDDFVNGRFAHLDLTDRDTLNLLMSAGRDRDLDRIPGFLVDLLLTHPQADALSALLRRPCTSPLTADAALRLVDHGGPVVAASAVASLHPNDLRARHAQACLDAGPFHASQGLGIPARQRPVRDTLATLESIEFPETDDDRPYDYPAEIADLDGARLPGADGWWIELPTSPIKLDTNATRMRNCTFGWDPAIRARRAFILVLHGPGGERLNASVVADGGHLRLGEVNSWANGKAVPDWLYRSLADCLPRRRTPRPLREAADIAPRAVRRGARHRRARHG